MKIDNKKAVICIVIAIVVVIAAFVINIALRSDKPNDDNPVMSDQPIVTDNANPDEANEPMPTYTNSDYVNNKTLSATDKINGTLTVGVNGSNINGLVLAPTYSAASDSRKIGYFMESEWNNRIVCSDGEYSDISSVNGNNVIIADTYDRLKTAAYTDDTNYGVCWTLANNPEPIDKSEIKIVVVDMSNHNVLSSFTVMVARNNNKYELSTIYNNDISLMPEERKKELWDSDMPSEEELSDSSLYSGEVDPILPLAYSDVNFDEIRTQLIAKAKQIHDSGEFGISEEPQEMIALNVELTDMTYHELFLNAGHSTAYKNTPAIYPLWAVTLNSYNPNIGHYTYYFYKESMAFAGMDFTHRNTVDEYESYTGFKIDTLRAN